MQEVGLKRTCEVLGLDVAMVEGVQLGVWDCFCISFAVVRVLASEVFFLYLHRSGQAG